MIGLITAGVILTAIASFTIGILVGFWRGCKVTKEAFDRAVKGIKDALNEGK